MFRSEWIWVKRASKIKKAEIFLIEIESSTSQERNYISKAKSSNEKKNVKKRMERRKVENIFKIEKKKNVSRVWKSK